MNFGKYVTRLSLVLFTILLASACDTGPEWAMRSYESENYSFTRFIENIERFPYTADQSKLSRVREGFKRLSLGFKKDDVKKIMGEPDFEMLHYKPKQKSEELIYSTWSYSLKRFESNLGKWDFDVAVVLHFKPNAELYWADPGNIAGLKHLGGPDLYPEAMITIRR